MPLVIETDSILSVAQTAKELNKPRLTIYRWIESGKLKAMKLGGVLFISADDVKDFKASMKGDGRLKNKKAVAG